MRIRISTGSPWRNGRGESHSRLSIRKRLSSMKLGRCVSRISIASCGSRLSLRKVFGDYGRASLIRRTRPLSSQITVRHMLAMTPMLWLTKRTVLSPTRET